MEPTTRRPRDVYFHVGLFKTGTSYLQRILLDSRAQLARQGVLVAGESRDAQNAAVWDLTGRRLRGADSPGVAGSWDALMASMLDWGGPKVVLSQENLVSVRPRQVRRIVEAFEPDRFHVVLTVRDLARSLPSQWQQDVTSGATWTWPEYLAAVRDPSTGLAGVGVGFWLKQDPVRILDLWGADLPPDRVHVVTVPPAGTSPEVLLDRFRTVTGIDVDAARAEETANSSVTAAGMETLRLLNARLDGSINERERIKVVGHTVRPALRELTGQAVRLPAADLGWVTERAEQTVAGLRSRGYDVVGTLDDLLPAAADAGPEAGDVVSDRELADALLVALTAQSQAHARTWTRLRRTAGGADDDVDAEGPVARSRGSVRALGYRTRTTALNLANRTALFGWLARRYHAWQHRSTSR